MIDELLTTRELAGRLRLGVPTIRSWARRGRIPALRVTSNRFRFVWSAVVEALGRTAVAPAQEASSADQPERGGGA
jgi:excisionase family DNA binding protein